MSKKLFIFKFVRHCFCLHWVQFLESTVWISISFLWDAKMAGSIRFLQFVQKFYQIIGVGRNQAPHSTRSTQKFFLIGSAQSMFTTAAFLMYEATSIFNYGYAFYILISIINSATIYVVFIWRSENTSKFIENCERFIEKSEYPLIQFHLYVIGNVGNFCCPFCAGDHSAVAYRELTEKIELFNKLLCFAITLTLAILYVSVLPYTFVRFYILNLGEDSFDLFYPPWCVNSCIGFICTLLN